jgi:hypothetical protein
LVGSGAPSPAAATTTATSSSVAHPSASLPIHPIQCVLVVERLENRPASPTVFAQCKSILRRCKSSDYGCYGLRWRVLSVSAAFSSGTPSTATPAGQCRHGSRCFADWCIQFSRAPPRLLLYGCRRGHPFSSLHRHPVDTSRWHNYRHGLKGGPGKSRSSKRSLYQRIFFLGLFLRFSTPTAANSSTLKRSIVCTHNELKFPWFRVPSPIVRPSATTRRRARPFFSCSPIYASSGCSPWKEF